MRWVQVYGVTIDSIPITGYSMYDTYRDSAVFYIKYNLGIGRFSPPLPD